VALHYALRWQHSPPLYRHRRMRVKMAGAPAATAPALAIQQGPQMKDHQWRRQLESYDFHCTLEPRYADMDAERHINNVAVQALHAEALMRFQMHASDGWKPDGALLHPMQSEVHFLKVTHYPEPVRCGVRLLSADENGFRLASAVFQAGACTSIQETLSLPWQHARRAPPQAVASLIAPMLRLADEAAPEPLEMDDDPAYPYCYRTTFRFGDLDADRCVSSLAIARFIEQGRVHLLHQAIAASGTDLRGDGLGLLVAKIAIRFLARREAGGEGWLRARLVKLGNASMVLRIVVSDQHGDLAFADNVMLFADRATTRPVPVPAAVRAWLAASPAADGNGGA
jgi:acyl-CoA thioesterase FadM